MKIRPDKAESRRIRVAIRHVLLQTWDPIGIRDEPNAQDEYDIRHVYRAGGDFADGVIAWDGEWLGGESFVSFDKEAVTVLKKQGMAARLLG